MEPSAQRSASDQAGLSEADAHSGSPCTGSLCRITAKSWETVALWSWDAGTETCAICKCVLSDVCIECQSQGHRGAAAAAGAGVVDATPAPSSGGMGVQPSGSSYTVPPDGDASLSSPSVAEAGVSTTETGCQISWGTCGHVFHAHCLNRWLPQRPSCPLCNRPWELRQVTSND